MVRVQWANLARITHIGIFKDHRESGPRFDVSSEGRCFSHHYTGALGPTQSTG